MAVNLHIPFTTLREWVASLPHLYSPGTYDIDGGWTLTRTYDPDGDQHGVRLHRGQNDLAALCRDGEAPRLETKIPLAARFEPIVLPRADDPKRAGPAYTDSTLALATVMIAIEDEFGGTLLDAEFRTMVAAAQAVDDENRARWSQHISRTIG